MAKILLYGRPKPESDKSVKSESVKNRCTRKFDAWAFRT